MLPFASLTVALLPVARLPVMMLLVSTAVAAASSSAWSADRTPRAVTESGLLTPVPAFASVQPDTGYYQRSFQAGSAPWHRLVDRRSLSNPGGASGRAVTVAVPTAVDSVPSLANGAADWPQPMSARPLVVEYPDRYQPGKVAGSQTSMADRGYQNSESISGTWRSQTGSVAHRADHRSVSSGDRFLLPDDAALYAPLPEKPPSGMPDLHSGLNVGPAQ